MGTADTQVIQKRVVIDLDRCIECGSCAAACYYSHANMPAVCFARAGVALLPVVCRQCKAAACVEACPNEAMRRDAEGVVRRALCLCIGCGSCAVACPFGIIPTQLAGVPVASRSPDRLSGRQAAKCDLCADRTEVDPRALPRCVAACPGGALMFLDPDEAGRRKLNAIGAGTVAANPYKRR